jgi:hypothetical protein
MVTVFAFFGHGGVPPYKLYIGWYFANISWWIVSYKIQFYYEDQLRGEEMKPVKTRIWDPATYLETDEEIAAYLTALIFNKWRATDCRSNRGCCARKRNEQGRGWGEIRTLVHYMAHLLPPRGFGYSLRFRHGLGSPCYWSRFLVGAWAGMPMRRIFPFAVSISNEYLRIWEQLTLPALNPSNSVDKELKFFREGCFASSEVCFFYFFRSSSINLNVTLYICMAVLLLRLFSILPLGYYSIWGRTEFVVREFFWGMEKCSLYRCLRKKSLARWIWGFMGNLCLSRIFIVSVRQGKACLAPTKRNETDVCYA